MIQPRFAKPSQLTEEKLTEAYQQTLYKVFYEDQTIVLRVGTPSAELTQLLQKLQYTTWALITAFNPHSQILGRDENAKRNYLLTSAVEKREFSFLRAAGYDPTGKWLPEESLLILDITQAEAVALGKTFQQNAILYGEVGVAPTLIWIANCKANN